MFKNYFFLNRFIIEANEELKGYRIESIFTQEKNKLILEFRSGTEEKYLEISVNPGFPYINLRRSFHRAKKNTVDFFKETSVLPSNLISFEIADGDRILRIRTDTITVYFTVRGKFTNVFFIPEASDIQSFKKNEDQSIEDFLAEVNDLRFLSGYNYLQLRKQNYNSWTELRNHFPVIGKEIVAEALARNKAGAEVPDIQILETILSEIKDRQAAVFIDESASEIRVTVDSFHIFSGTKYPFESFILALNFYFSKFYQLETSDDKKKIIKKHLDRESGKLSSKLNDIKNRIDAGSKEKEYKKIGELLLINRHLLAKGSKIVEVPDIYNDNLPVLVKLKETLSPQGNIDYYFDKSRSEKINYDKSRQLYSSLRKEFEKLKKIEERFNNIENPDNLIVIMKELKIKTAEQKVSPKDELKDKFKQYIIFDKYNVYVGRDSTNNDLLTTKFAKQNDYWFHARSVPGSHVVLRVENTKEAVPKDVLKKAAALAGYHSKAKTSGMVPVSYTQKKYVIKKKGMEPGKVALLKEEVLIVKPEIPPGCIYLGND